MAMTTVGQGADSEEQEVMAAINTTPLVDVMLVLLIIFLITIPAIVQQVPLELPKERNVPTQTKPENIVIAVNKDGDVFWGMEYLKDSRALFEKLKKVAVMVPQPEVHIRADEDARYESVGKVVATLQRASILKIGFITEPPARSLAGS
jgi:biopolymer transport protein ExbD